MAGSAILEKGQAMDPPDVINVIKDAGLGKHFPDGRESAWLTRK